jgi:hypothetical protein
LAGTRLGHHRRRRYCRHRRGDSRFGDLVQNSLEKVKIFAIIMLINGFPYHDIMLYRTR